MTQFVQNLTKVNRGPLLTEKIQKGLIYWLNRVVNIKCQAINMSHKKVNFKSCFVVYHQIVGNLLALHQWLCRISCIRLVCLSLSSIMLGTVSSFWHNSFAVAGLPLEVFTCTVEFPKLIMSGYYWNTIFVWMIH